MASTSSATLGRLPLAPAPASRQSALRVTVLRDRAALAGLVPAWDELAANALEPNPFYESWMLLPAIEHFGAGADLRVVAVWNGATLAALLPLERVRGYKGLPLRALQTWRHRHCMLCTPLVRADGAAESLAGLLAWLRAEDEGASLMAFGYLVAGSPFHSALVDALAAADLHALTSDAYMRAVLRRASDAQTYIDQSISRHERQELRRRERRLAEMGTVRHVALRPGAELAPWIDELLRLEAGGWKGEEGSALACSEANRRFANEIFAAAFQRQRLQIVGIDLDGKPLARCTSILAANGAYAFKTAYDEAFARFSPGVLAEIDRIRELHAMPGIEWIDSYTAPGNRVLNRLFNGRLTLQSLVFGTSALGELGVATLPLARWIKRHLLRKRGSGASAGAAMPSSSSARKAAACSR